MKLFWWQSPDGSRVLTYFPHDYVNELEPLRIASDVSALEVAHPGVPEMMHLYGVGDHGGGPTRVMLEDGEHWSKPDVIFPKTNFGVAQGFFRSTRESDEALNFTGVRLLGFWGSVLG